MIICCGGLFVVSKFVLQFKELSDSINTPCDEFQYDFLKVSLPPGATILDEQCTEFMTPTYSVIFEMSPEDLATFQQQPPVSNIDEWQTDTSNSFFTEESMQERKEKLKREGMKLESLLYGKYSDGSILLSILIDTSDSQQYIVEYSASWVD